MIRIAIAAFAMMAAASEAVAVPGHDDATETALQRCLAAPGASSTAGQTECEMAALRRYDQRLNLAYSGLMRRLPASAAAQLRAAQRAWIAFRVADDRARGALYETRQGTMYVPMQAAAAVVVVRDRALQLENALRVLTIDDG
jgi:uncharacterized protein YecT (DUF1311 family)